ncbi:hypothetical protein ACROYT_G018690 [Oculina patagonica]
MATDSGIRITDNSPDWSTNKMPRNYVDHSTSVGDEGNEVKEKMAGIARRMNGRILEKSRINASIVISALAVHQIARYMNVHIQERSPIHASIVINALASYHFVSNMKEFIQERSRIHVNIAKSALDVNQIARNMNEYIQE